MAPATGYYIQIGAPGVRVGGAGFYEAPPARLAELRKAIDHDRHGPELEKLVRRLTRAGWEIGGDRLKTAPRGYDVDHPRIDLLRHKSLFAGRDYGFDEVIHTPALVDRVRKDWRATTPARRLDRAARRYVNRSARGHRCGFARDAPGGHPPCGLFNENGTTSTAFCARVAGAWSY